MDDVRWPGEWLRGVLELGVLAILDGAGAHGYAIAQQLGAAGLGQVKGGTLYPLLARLEVDGLVTASWQAGEGGPGRKVFAITAEGRRELTRRARSWDEFTRTVSALVRPEHTLEVS
jgi:PadR family transcriptional regulator PadR